MPALESEANHIRKCLKLLFITAEILLSYVGYTSGDLNEMFLCSVL